MVNAHGLQMLEDLLNNPVLQNLAVTMLSQPSMAADSLQAVPEAHQPRHGHTCQEVSPLQLCRAQGADFCLTNLHLEGLYMP